MSDEHDSVAEELPLLGAGDQLRVAREAKGLDIEHIAAETRIPLRHLQAIEAGNFEALPSRTYAVGFSRTYAGQVGLDGDKIVELVREELAELQDDRAIVAGGMEPGDSAKLPSAGLAWFGAFAAIILAIGLVTYFGSYFASGSGPASLIAQSDVADEAVASAEAAPVGDADGVAAAPPADGLVVFTATEDVWVRISDAAGDRLFEGTLVSGDTFELPRSAAEPRINTGRPDALAITIDGQSVPRLAEGPVQLGDAPISAVALLARADTTGSPASASN